ncbi:MAG: hypothetical protein HQK54_13715 [Oligoflexales bacterium]|nr:hypothetical protein [Oligoflexales bacterium]
MGLIAQAGIIAATAFQTGLPCSQVFKKLAYLAYPASQIEMEESYMDKLAESACNTQNPDVIWQIVSIETSFQFRIVRINGTAKVLKGQDAISYLTKLKQKHINAENVDIGVMQFNYYWHRDSFEKNPLKMLDPSEQVKYLVEDFQPSLEKMCKGDWIGCYHNPKNGERARIYLGFVAKSKRILKEKTALLLKDHESNSIPFRAMS